MILCIETATSLCSVSLCNRNHVVASRESNDLKSHASLLTVFTGEVLREAGITAKDLEAIAVSKGPGSYTGLRIGVSAAKGLAFAASIPLIGVETTLSMFYGMRESYSRQPGEEMLFCPVLDAKRMEVYYAIYDSEGKTVKDISAEVITGQTFTAIAAESPIMIFGNGATKLKSVVRQPAVTFGEDFKMSATHLMKPAYIAFDEGKFENVAYFEPFYLKDFIATKPKKNILDI